MTTVDERLRALDEGTAFTRRRPADLLHLRGDDARDLVQRIAASDLGPLGAATAMAVVFTEDKGRTVDVATAVEEDGLLLFAGPDRGEALAAWLDRWIIMEDARVEPASGRVVFDLFGRTASLRGAELAGVDLPAPGAVAGDRHRLVTTRLAAPPAHLLVDEARADEVRTALASTLTEVGEEDLVRWCAREGVFRPGPGLEAGCHPLELGLRALVSFTKGCYIGQEVVARLDTYDKVKRRLAVLATEGPAAVGVVLRHEGRKCGVVLEAGPAGGLEDGRAYAVAVVDKALEPGAALEVEGIGAGTLLRIPAPDASATNG